MNYQFIDPKEGRFVESAWSDPAGSIKRPFCRTICHWQIMRAQLYVCEQLAKSVSTLADSVSRRQGLLAANVSRRTALFASRAIYVGKLLQVAVEKREPTGGLRVAGCRLSRHRVAPSLISSSRASTRSRIWSRMALTFSTG